MPHVVVSKTRGEPVDLYYEVHGTGPARILFIMGLSTACQGWENQSDYFGNILGDEFTCCIFDNRGMGLSSSPRGTYRTSEMAKDALELLQHLGWAEKEVEKDAEGNVPEDAGVHLVGISMGGMISQELFILRPKLFKSVALISTHAGMTVPPTNAFTMMPRTLMQRTPEDKINVGLSMLYPPEWLDAAWKLPAIKTARDGPANFKTNREWVTYRSIERAKRTRVQTPQGALGQLAAVGTHYVSYDRLRQITAVAVPKLVITGTIDNLVRPTNSTYLAEVLQGELVIMAGGGHALIGERYEEINELLLNHFRSAKSFTLELQKKQKEQGVSATEAALAREADIGRKVMEAGTPEDMQKRAERAELERSSYLSALNLETIWA